MDELLNTLYVQTQGASLYLDHDAVRVVLPDADKPHRLPLRRLDGIAIYGHVTISSELLSRCAADGLTLTWMSASGRYLARVDGPTRGNVLLRHAQHAFHDDTAKRTTIARTCVAGKIQNSRQVLLRAARDSGPALQTALRATAADLEQDLATVKITDTVEALLGVEGAAARRYFTSLGTLLSDELDIGQLLGRNRRPSTDPVNALLSYVYGLLRALVHGSLEHVGLDPYVGFLHGLRPGKPSLALDLMEEFRPILADRFAMTLLNRRQIRGEHFENLPGGAVRLTEDGRRTLLTAWQQWRQHQWRHQLLSRKVAAGLLPIIQARILARHLRGELPSYLPWTVT